MSPEPRSLFTRIMTATMLLAAILSLAVIIAMATGSSDIGLGDIFHHGGTGRHNLATAIIWRIRFPRVVLAATVGATLATGGLVFQALLRNSLAEPYILGVSGGSAIGAIIASIIGLSPFLGIPLAAFTGSMATLVMVLVLSGGGGTMNRESLLLGGVMVNALCSAGIMFLISITSNAQAHKILFWLMGDLSMFTVDQMVILPVLIPCFFFIFIMARPMNLLLLGRENAANLGVNVGRVFYSLLIVTSFMVSLVVCNSGLIGFCGLVVPHILRTILGPDHRILVPASVLGGAAFLVICDLLSRTLPAGGEMPVGVITAMIGAPLFIFLLWRSKKCG